MKKTLYFYHEEWLGFQDPERHISVWDTDVGEQIGSRIRVFLCAIEVDLPDVDILTTSQVNHFMIGKLREEKTKIQAETHLKIQNIEEQIQKLQCLENKEAENA